MFHRRWPILVAMLILGAMLFSGARNSREQSARAWQEGFIAGQLAAQGNPDSAPALPPSAYYAYNNYRGDGGPGGIFPFIFLGLGLLALVRIGRFWAWRRLRRGGPFGPGPWGGERHFNYGGPWGRGDWQRHHHGPWEHEGHTERGPWGHHQRGDGSPWHREQPTRERPVNRGPLDADEVI